MAKFDPQTPYNDLPMLPPADGEIETSAILKKCVSWITEHVMKQIYPNILQTHLLGW